MYYQFLPYSFAGAELMVGILCVIPKLPGRHIAAFCYIPLLCSTRAERSFIKYHCSFSNISQVNILESIILTINNLCFVLLSPSVAQCSSHSIVSY